ncbi:MAG TPA: hypothetical protein VMM93_05665 [Vicinamibacterales bacterium]|nr:hypothetical protein [Vicinamibacterales bacterium]
MDVLEHFHACARQHFDGVAGLTGLAADGFLLTDHQPSELGALRGG